MKDKQLTKTMPAQKVIALCRRGGFRLIANKNGGYLRVPAPANDSRFAGNAA